jgi:hypothetical protein
MNKSKHFLALIIIENQLIAMIMKQIFVRQHFDQEDALSPLYDSWFPPGQPGQ